jgi:hypothetical protein
VTFTFYMGAHHCEWLARASVPLFVSRRELGRRKTLPRAVTPWALDSGGFTELSLHGRWTLSAADYVAQARRFRDEVGMLQWAAPQDMMCEPEMLARTGLTVEQHQALTIENYLELRALAPEMPFVPVLQGWCFGDYMDHAEAYERAGVDLAALQLVGVGTVCRRQHTARVSQVLCVLHSMGLKLHAFGLKKDGLRSSVNYLASSDSMAWSANARRNPGDRIAGHTHKSCSNCIEWAMGWRQDALESIGRAA